MVLEELGGRRTPGGHTRRNSSPAALRSGRSPDHGAARRTDRRARERAAAAARGGPTDDSTGCAAQNSAGRGAVSLFGGARTERERNGGNHQNIFIAISLWPTFGFRPGQEDPAFVGVARVKRMSSHQQRLRGRPDNPQRSSVLSPCDKRFVRPRRRPGGGTNPQDALEDTKQIRGAQECQTSSSSRTGASLRWTKASRGTSPAREVKAFQTRSVVSRATRSWLLRPGIKAVAASRTVLRPEAFTRDPKLAAEAGRKGGEGGVSQPSHEGRREHHPLGPAPSTESSARGVGSASRDRRLFHGLLARWLAGRQPPAALERETWAGPAACGTRLRISERIADQSPSQPSGVALDEPSALPLCA